MTSYFTCLETDYQKLPEYLTLAIVYYTFILGASLKIFNKNPHKKSIGVIIRVHSSPIVFQQNGLKTLFSGKSLSSTIVKVVPPNGKKSPTSKMNSFYVYVSFRNWYDILSQPLLMSDDGSFPIEIE